MIRPYSLDDVGTRRDHLSDLQLLWSDGLSILMTQMAGYATDDEKEKKIKLENALELLEHHMTKDFNFGWDFGRVIDDLPKDARRIKDEEDERDQADGKI